MYNELKALLEAGYEVRFRPRKNGDVKMTVVEAKNGTVKGCEVELNPFEWGLVENGISTRLQEAIRMLNNPSKPTPKNCPHCRGMGWTPSTSHGDPTDPCHPCKGTGKA